jgi:hypothetical protein
MPNRTAKFVSAIFASLLAGAALATVSHGTAGAADDCLSGPKGETPEGSHWYYRIDRVTKQHCWYLRGETEKLSQAAQPAAAPPTKPVAAKTEAMMQRSVADARAELPPPTRIEQPRRGDEIPAIPADVATRDNYGATAMPGPATPGSVIASRWPDPSAVALPADPAPVKRDVVAAVSPPMQAPAPSVVAAGAIADASAHAPSYSSLAALTAALALAGILGAGIFKASAARRSAPTRIRARRGAVWESTDDDRIALSDHANALPRRSGFARGLDQDANQRIEAFFARLSKRAPS